MDRPGARVRASVARVVETDALGASDSLFGSTAPANLLLVGAAYQLGALPFFAAGVEEAIELNGVAVAANVAAFRWGRVAVADPVAFAAAVSPGAVLATRPFDLGRSPLAGETRRLVEVRAELLRAHSGARAARRYVAVVERAWAAERVLFAGTDRDDTAYSQAVARGVAHLAAYKDEYEVARLLTRPELLAQVQQQVPGATDVRFDLHPPALRVMGMSRKLKLRAWSRPLLKATAKAKVLRGTRLDLFGAAPSVSSSGTCWRPTRRSSRGSRPGWTRRPTRSPRQPPRRPSRRGATRTSSSGTWSATATRCADSAWPDG